MYIRYGFLWLTAVILVTSVMPAFAATDEPPETLLHDGICPVTKLKANDYPDWQVCYRDKEDNWRVFVGIKNFVAFINDPEQYIGEKIQLGGLVLIRDYSTKKWIPAIFAHFVIGDSITGPTGRDAIAFADKDKAEKYSKKSKAKGVIRFVGLRKSVLAYLNNVKLDSTEVDSAAVPVKVEIKKPPPGAIRK